MEPGMAALQTPKKVAFDLVIESKASLYLSWIPLMKGGGLFIPTPLRFELGDEVEVLLTLLQHRRKVPLSCRVAWINPPSTHRTTGIGVQLPDGDIGRRVAKKIELVLAGTASSARPTYTL